MKHTIPDAVAVGVGIGSAILIAIGLAPGCASLSSALAMPVSAHSDQVAAIALAESVWTTAADACIQYAEQKGVAPSLTPCAAPLRTARALLIAASQAVDTNWTTSAGCSLLQAVEITDMVAENLGAPANVTKSIAAAKEISSRIAGATCAAPVIPITDAGPVAAPKGLSI
jgi:hypothetical protein